MLERADRSPEGGRFNLGIRPSASVASRRLPLVIPSLWPTSPDARFGARGETIKAFRALRIRGGLFRLEDELL